MVVSGIFGWMPIFTLRKRGGVPEGKSYIITRIFVNSGIYVARHPQFFAGMLISLVLVLRSQHWLRVFSGIMGSTLFFLDVLKEKQMSIIKFGDEYKHYMQSVPRMNFIFGIITLLKQGRK